MNNNPDYDHSCPICRIQHAPKNFRFKIIGRFNSKTEVEQIGQAYNQRLALEMVESFKKWPAIDPDSLSVLDILTL